MGVTTLDAPKIVLPSHVLQQLSPSKFMLGSPAERMDAVIEAALMRWCSGFSISHKVAVFLRNYFINQDGTLTSFIRALKVCKQVYASQNYYVMFSFFTLCSELLCHCCFYNAAPHIMYWYFQHD